MFSIESAGRVIGKKGAVINNIKRETHASFINALDPVGTSLWAAGIFVKRSYSRILVNISFLSNMSVAIHGTASAVLAAYNAVSDLVHGEVDDVVAEFTIHRSKHSFLIGGDSRKSLEVFFYKRKGSYIIFSLCFNVV